MAEEPNRSFENMAQEKSAGMVREIWGMLMQNKKFWMIPIFIVLLLFGVLLILGSTGAAPFIYTLF
jgi:uncharacterized protein DUF5989